VVMGCSAATYYFIESPMQKLGHRLSKYLQARFGADTIPPPAPEATPVPAEAAASH
jgi:peptidoglycan/LPS O-acetylase OafA/YrhL